jgi:hypothetical protein
MSFVADLVFRSAQTNLHWGTRFALLFVPSACFSCLVVVTLARFIGDLPFPSRNLLRDFANITIVEIVPVHTGLFLETFRSFPWRKYDFDFFVADREERRSFLNRLMKHASDEPHVPINETCHPPELPSPDETNCSRWPSGLTGRKRTYIPKIATLLQFGFEADVLEIHLNELDPVVDRIFLIESTVAHAVSHTKPLVWEHIKNQPRFAKFCPKVVSFILDDSYYPVDRSDARRVDWSNEYLQERMRWELFKKWNEATHMFGDDDIVGFGDTDEIPSTENLHLLKYCEMKEPSVDIGTWFTFFSNRRYQNDWPIPGYPHHYGDPTYRGRQKYMRQGDLAKELSSE